MSPARIATLLGWIVPVLAFVAGVAVGRLPDLQGAAAAHAEILPSPLERLVAEDEIRQKLALYGLYADGDGMDGHPRDLRTRGGPPKILIGREIIAKSPPENDPEISRRVAGRHYLVSTVFDDVTATTAHTRTASVYFDATKNNGGADCRKTEDATCPGKPVKTIMWVYQMTWKKTPQGWQIARNVLRDDN